MAQQGLPRPYGDSFLVSTPNIDRVGQMMIADQKQREINYQKQNDELDKEFAKNAAGIRDADVGDFTKQYGEYKTLSQNLYRNGKKMTDADRINMQLEKQRKLGEIYGLINKSKLEKDNEETYAKDVMKHPDNYEDNAHPFLVQRRNMPVSQMKVTVPNPKTGQAFDVDFSDIDGNIRYKQGNTDFSPILKKAEGSLVLRGNPVTEKTSDGLQTKTTQYKAVASPTEYLSALHSGVAGSQKTKHFPLEFNYSDDDANKIIDAYSVLKETPAFKAAYPNEKDLPPILMQTPAGRAMTLRTMEHALNNPPVPTYKTERNLGAINDLKNKDWLWKNGITQAQKRANILLNKSATETGTTVNDVYTDLISNKRDINTYTEQGKPIKAARWNTLNNSSQVVVSQILKTAYPDQDPNETYQITNPDQTVSLYRVNDDGQPKPSEKTRLLTFDKTGINLKAPQPSVKEKRQVVADGNTVVQTKPQVHTGYTKADLKSAGWSDDQINKAVKAGKIKLN